MDDADDTVKMEERGPQVMMVVLGIIMSDQSCLPWHDRGSSADSRPGNRGGGLPVEAFQSFDRLSRSVYDLKHDDDQG